MVSIFEKLFGALVSNTKTKNGNVDQSRKTKGNDSSTNVSVGRDVNANTGREEEKK